MVSANFSRRCVHQMYSTTTISHWIILRTLSIYLPTINIFANTEDNCRLATRELTETSISRKQHKSGIIGEIFNRGLFERLLEHTGECGAKSCDKNFRVMTETSFRNKTSRRSNRVGLEDLRSSTQNHRRRELL